MDARMKEVLKWEARMIFWWDSEVNHSIWMGLHLETLIFLFDSKFTCWFLPQTEVDILGESDQWPISFRSVVWMYRSPSASRFLPSMTWRVFLLSSSIFQFYLLYLTWFFISFPFIGTKLTGREKSCWNVFTHWLSDLFPRCVVCMYVSYINRWMNTSKVIEMETWNERIRKGKKMSQGLNSSGDSLLFSQFLSHHFHSKQPNPTSFNLLSLFSSSLLPLKLWWHSLAIHQTVTHSTVKWRPWTWNTQQDLLWIEICQVEQQFFQTNQHKDYLESNIPNFKQNFPKFSF